MTREEWRKRHRSARLARRFALYESRPLRYLMWNLWIVGAYHARYLGRPKAWWRFSEVYERVLGPLESAKPPTL